MTPRLSVVTLVLNNDAGLARCSESLRALKTPYEHIIAVDNRSADSTVVLAQKLGKAYTFNWPDSFARACNDAFEFAKADWILRLDSDEVLNIPGIIDELLTKPEFAGFNAFAFNTVHVQKDGKINNVSATLTRLVKRGLGFKYHGRVHEQLYRGDDPTSDDNLYVTIEDPVIVHFGYDESNVHEKLERNNRLAAMDAWDDGNMLGLYHLARGYAFVGDMEEAKIYALMTLSENPPAGIRAHCLQIAEAA